MQRAHGTPENDSGMTLLISLNSIARSKVCLRKSMSVKISGPLVML